MGSDERIAVEGRPGITCRRTPGGRVRFEISVSDGEGEPQHLTVAGGLARAEAALAAHAAAQSSVTHTMVLTFGEALERWLESPSINTRERQDYEWPVYVHLVPRLGHLQLARLGEWHAIALLDELRDAGYTSWSIQTVLEPMQKMTRFALEQGLLLRDPLAALGAVIDEETRPVRAEVEGCTIVDIRRFKATLLSS